MARKNTGKSGRPDLFSANQYEFRAGVVRRFFSIPPIRIIGIDFSGARNPGNLIWFTRARFADETLTVQSLFPAGDLATTGGIRREQALPALVRWILREHGQGLIGCDFPFSLPLEFATLWTRCTAPWASCAVTFCDRTHAACLPEPGAQAPMTAKALSSTDPARFPIFHSNSPLDQPWRKTHGPELMRH